MDPNEISINCFSAFDENGTRHEIKINKEGGLITNLRNIDYVLMEVCLCIKILPHSLVRSSIRLQTYISNENKTWK